VLLQLLFLMPPSRLYSPPTSQDPPLRGPWQTAASLRAFVPLTGQNWHDAPARPRAQG
jgi:hypothetical protein